MINPNYHAAKALEVVAEQLKEWPKDTDFVYLNGATIYYVQGGSAALINYISREQWAAARTLICYWRPEKRRGFWARLFGRMA